MDLPPEGHEHIGSPAEDEGYDDDHGETQHPPPGVLDLGRYATRSRLVADRHLLSFLGTLTQGAFWDAVGNGRETDRLVVRRSSVKMVVGVELDRRVLRDGFRHGVRDAGW